MSENLQTAIGMEMIKPGIVAKDDYGDEVVQDPTNLEYLVAFALYGFQWAEDALPAAIEAENLKQWPFNNGGGI